MILKILLLIAGIFRKLNHQSSVNLKKIRLINNNIVFKDCLKIG
jgi:hypothetical protein